MPRVYVSIGSNIAPEANIRSAVSRLRRRYGRLAVSTVYESRPVGFDGNNFYNLVVGFDTDEDLSAITGYLRTLEAEHGRVRDGNRFSSRPLDLDVLLYGDTVMQRPSLRLPRSEILEYAFVLGPLAELAPTERHPMTGETYEALWRRFNKTAQPLWPAPLVLDC
jgi:2-amino-4-hydroxy-6-hydroxymethyldihydropteridine diphosphokinase